MTTGKKETALYLVLRFTSKALAYPVLYLLANLFTKDEYGLAMFFLSFFHLGTTLLFLGLPQALVPFIVRERDLSSINFVLVATTGLATAGVAAIAVGLPLVWPLAACLPFLLLHRIELSILQSRHQHHFYQLSMLGHVLAPLILLYVFRERGSMGIVGAYAIGYAVTPIVTAFWVGADLFRVITRIRIALDDVVREYFAAAAPLALIGLSFMVLGWLDSAVLGLMTNYEDVASYNIASSLANVIGIAPLSIAMFILTRSAQIEKDEAARGLLDRSLRISVSLTLVMATILGAVLTPITALIFKSYVGVEIYAAILLVGVAFYAYYVVGVNYLAGRFTAADALVPMLTAMTLNLVLDVVLVPRFGLYGIVAATTAAHACGFVLLHRKIGGGGKFFLVFLFAPVAVSAHLLGWYGLLLAPVLVPLLLVTRLLTKSDLDAIVTGLRGQRSVYGGRDTP